MADTGKILLDHFLSEREKDTFIPELSLVALDRARAMGYGAVFLGGNPKLYGRFGFEPSYKYGINHVKGIGNRAYANGCLVCELQPGALDGVSGTTSYYAGE